MTLRLILVLGCATVCNAAAHAAENTLPSVPAQPPPPAKDAGVIQENRFPIIVPVPNFGRTPAHYDSFSDPIFQLKDARRRWAEAFREDLVPPIFFPPSPPALAEERSTVLRTLSRDYPSGLIEYVSEPFYMAYGSLRYRHWLSTKRAERIEDYSKTQQQLVAALRAKLEETKDFSPPQRRDALQAFAALQASSLDALETEAEAIRTDLTSPGFFRTAEDGTHLIQGAHLHAGEIDEQSVKFIFPAIAAQFYEGFSTEQRLLLHEMTMEQRELARSAASEKKGPATDYIFFSPATARIRLPADLPADLAGKLRRFHAHKDALKRELQTAIDRDDFVFIFQRRQRFQELAEQQAPEFAALNALAEEIRGGLARIPYPDAPARSELPADLTRRVGLAVVRKADLQRELTGHFKKLREEFGSGQVEIVRHGKALALAVDFNAPRLTGAKRDHAQAELSAFNDAIARRYIDLADEMDALRTDIQNHAGHQNPAIARNVDQLAAEFNKSYSAQETWNRFHHYYLAVLQPGLSPAQRRLLYRAALVDLFKARTIPSS